MAKKIKRRTQAERSEETRAKLLDAAFEVMRRRGYVGFRTAEVAKVAGVSRGAQLHHFPTKESLVVAAVEHVFARALAEARLRADRAASQHADAIEAIAADSSDFFFGDYFFVALDVMMAAAKDNRIRERIAAISRSNRVPVENAWHKVLVDAGLPPGFAEDALWLTVSIVRGLAIRTLWQKDKPRFDRLLRLWRDIFWTYAKAEGLIAAPPKKLRLQVVGGNPARSVPGAERRKPSKA
ncbi:MAG TPA: TetR/AcrR family transcriptional regulator [Stellaceae bacterium]|nr:TetR/AcrR family transcriptional regulator [Stellaceae bacterium]